MRRDTHPSPPYQACCPSPRVLLLATSSSALASVPCDSESFRFSLRVGGNTETDIVWTTDEEN
ncbi:hypothetical protein PISMIDRAFT_687807, partial [Pisolithus microcarpus 441]